MAPKYPIDPALLTALQGEDQLGMVVRAHIHIEARLIRLLEQLIPFSEELPRLRYEQRVQLACAMGMYPDMSRPLKLLGDIRNRFGHKLDTALTAGMLDEWLASFSDDDRRLILKAYLRTKEQAGAAVPTEFAALSPKDKFILISVTLDGMLAVVIGKASEKKAGK